MHRSGGRIVNFSTVAVPFHLEGEAVYAASKAAVVSLAQVLARELATYEITVNAVGPTPVKTDLIWGVSATKIDALVKRQAIARLGEFRDVANVVVYTLLHWKIYTCLHILVTIFALLLFQVVCRFMMKYVEKSFINNVLHHVLLIILNPKQPHCISCRK
jgi:short-subunit dehydrogenase